MAEKKKIRFGLGTKFVLLVVVISTLALGSMAWYLALRQEQSYAGHLKEKATLLGRQVSLIAVEPLLAFDFAGLDSIMSDVNRESDVVYSVMYDLQGNHLTSYVDDANPYVKKAMALTAGKGGPPAIYKRLFSFGNIIHLKFPVKRGEQTMAWLKLGISKDRLQQDVKDLLYRHVSLNVTVILLLCIAIYTVFRHQAMRPIARLVDGANRVAEGDLTAPVKKVSHDELGRLTEAFNSMMTNLMNTMDEKEQALSQLKELNKHLEDRVAQRTKALQASEERVRAVIDNIGEGIFTLDEKGYVDSMNPAAHRIFELHQNEHLGLHSLLLLGDEHTRPLLETNHYEDDIHSPFKSTELGKPKELTGQRLNGEVFPMEINLTDMYVNGTKKRVCIVRDISRRKHVEYSLADAQAQLIESAHKAGMAEMATGVLHNIGNLLNSVNLAAEEIHHITRQSKVDGLRKAVDMLESHDGDLHTFLNDADKGRKWRTYLKKLSQVLCDENSDILRESEALYDKVAMMKEVIRTQQDYAKSVGRFEPCNPQDIVRDALKVQNAVLHKYGVKVHTEFAEVPACWVQRSKLLQVLTNLIKNAVEAMKDNDLRNRAKELTIKVEKPSLEFVRIRVMDNGEGLDEEHRHRIFHHGFTTKSKGHGFGLHTSANAMTEMGGKVEVQSAGKEQGAEFILSLPLQGPRHHSLDATETKQGEPA